MIYSFFNLNDNLLQQPFIFLYYIYHNIMLSQRSLFSNSNRPIIRAKHSHIQLFWSNNIMSSINQGSSESLVIAEGKPDFLINSTEEKPKMDDDLFELSKDEPSLSFQIEEERKNMQIKQICRASKDDTLILNVIQAPPEENRKRRKDIFDKFKKEKSKDEDDKAESNLLNIFDSIFSKKSPQPANFCGVYDHSNEFIRVNVDNATSRSRTPSAERRARLKIFDKKKNPQTFENVLPANILDESQKFPDIKPTQSRLVQPESPRQLRSNESPIKLKKKEESLNFSSLENRFSAIELQDQDFSRDSFEINTILQSEIFKDQNQRTSNVQLIDNRFSKKMVQIPDEIVKNLPTTISEPAEQQMFQKKNPISIEPIQSEPVQISSKQNTIIQMASANFIKIQPNKEVLSPLAQPQQMQQTKYLNNDFSSMSSNPSFFVQNYQSLQGSMVNLNKQFFSEASTFKPNELKNVSPNLLVESRIVEQNQQLIKDHVFEEETRLPLFLRKVRKHISIYPNFYIMKNTPNTSEAINQEFKLLFSELRISVEFLSNMCQKILDAKSKKQIYLDQMLSALTLESFLDSGWENINKFDQQYELIKPLEPIDVRGWSYQKAKTALVNYENIVSYYDNKGIRLDLTSEKGRRKYFEIRQKFWDIIANMKLISQDIFCQMRNCLFPNHYYQFHKFLMTPFPVRLNEKRLNYVRKLSNLYKYQKNLNDLLVNSSIGDKIGTKIQLELRYLCPF